MLEQHGLIVISALLLAYGLFSRLLSRGIVTGQMVFLGAGLAFGLVAERTNQITLSPTVGVDLLVRVFGEIALIVLLFTDAARIDLRALRRDLAMPARMLGIGMPLMIAIGMTAAWLLFPQFGVWELALLAAILAPTDAALSHAVVSNEVVPLRVRQALCVESGLNDGLAVPLILFFAWMASAAGPESMPESPYHSFPGAMRFASLQLLLGLIAGVAIGGLGAKCLDHSIRREWIDGAFCALSGVSLALLAAIGAEHLGGNAFIAAYVGGLTFGNVSRRSTETMADFAEPEGILLMLLTFFLVGVMFVEEALASVTWHIAIYAVLSLACVRMIAMSVSLLGLRTSLETRIFLGWFGPRGLASALFGLLLLEGLTVPHSDLLFAVVMLTVVLSVMLHGATSAPLARWYATRLDSTECAAAQRPCRELSYRTRHGLSKRHIDAIHTELVPPA